MLVPFTTLLHECDAAGAALGAFTCYDAETAQGVLAAAGGRDVGVVLLVSRDAFCAPSGAALLAALREIAAHAPARACLQLDHVSDLELMARAFELGCGAVMADGSRLPFADNVELVRSARALAEPFGGAVEGELGHVAGGEDVARAVEAGGFTDPAEARRFAEETGVDCLAVSIGNVHGTYAQPPRLDWDRLDWIRGAVGVPLSLHGASGLSSTDVRRSVGAGIRKINVNTELREAYLSATQQALDDVRRGARLMELHGVQTDAAQRVAEGKFEEYRGVSA